MDFHPLNQDENDQYPPMNTRTRDSDDVLVICEYGKIYSANYDFRVQAWYSNYATHERITEKVIGWCEMPELIINKI